MMEKKVVVLAAMVGASMFAHAGFGDFLKKAAAVSDALTGTGDATSAVTTGQQATTAAANPGQAAATVAQEAAGTAVQPATAATAAVEDTAIPGEINEIDMDELRSRMKKDPSIVVIDVRSAGEFASGHLPRAKNIPVDSIAAKIGKTVPSKETPVYLYCRSGARATTAAAALIEKGYRRVYNAGGIQGWSGKLVR